MKKIIGLVLLVLGVLIILWGIWDCYNIFTAKKAAPEIFKIEETIKSGGTKTGIEGQIQQVIKEQLGGILPADSIPQMLNLISWSIFMFILFFGAGKISAIGIKLLK